MSDGTMIALGMIGAAIILATVANNFLRQARAAAVKYREQRPEVVYVEGDAEPVHVKFADVTLCLDEIQASWLEANIGRIKREAERRREAAAEAS